MKTLTLLRHAKSTWDDPVARDFDRPLNRRGKNSARTIGREMRALGLEFDHVIASPAVRVIETLAYVAEGYGRPIEPAYDKRLYLASTAMLIELIQATGDAAETLLVVGHNPGLESLALQLTRATDNGLRSEIEVKYPTATIAQIALPVDRWKDVGQGIGNITRFIRPRDLDPMLGPDEDS